MIFFKKRPGYFWDFHGHFMAMWKYGHLGFRTGMDPRMERKKQNGLSWGSDFGFKNLHKYWYLQCFRHFSAVKPRWNANFELWFYEEAHKILYCNYQCLVHFTALKPRWCIMVSQANHVGSCWHWSMLRIIVFLKLKRYNLRHVCHSSFLHTGLFLIHGKRKTEERWGRSDHIDSSNQVKQPKHKGIPKNIEQCVC